MKLILQAIKALFRKIEASRTHWDTRKSVTKEYTFDGNTEGKETIQMDEHTILVKVADTFPEVSSITSLSIAYTGISEGLVDEYELSPIDDAWIEGGIYVIDDGAYYAPNGGELSGVYIPSGLYFAYWIDNGYTSKLSVTYIDGELKKLDKKYLPDQTQPDWNQNDETAEDHIKNRTHYEEVLDEYVIFEGTLPAYTSTTDLPIQYAIPSGIRVTAYYNGSVVAAVVGSYSTENDGGTWYYGFSPDLDMRINNNTMTASVYNGLGDGMLKFVVENFTAVHTLDEKYLPNNVTGMISSKMDAINPVGTGSFSMGRKPGSAVGNRSHAEGNNTTASGGFSHAEGYSTTASGAWSHTEGGNTTASGHSSHAEGSNTTASGEASHAEGAGTTASSYYSHAEGNHTTASSENQHVQGKHNVEDSQNKYAHIVGNGTKVSARSNAHTLDWNGNAWYAGDVYVGSTSGINKDEGSKKLATEEYVDSKQDTLIQSGAAVGQIAKITAVDDTGKPTAWEAVDMPGDGDVWELIYYGEITKDIGSVIVDKDSNGNDFSLKEYKLIIKTVAATENPNSGFSWYWHNDNGGSKGPFYTISGAHGGKTLVFTGKLCGSCWYCQYISDSGSSAAQIMRNELCPDGGSGPSAVPVYKLTLSANAGNTCGTGSKVALFGVRA